MAVCENTLFYDVLKDSILCLRFGFPNRVQWLWTEHRSYAHLRETTESHQLKWNSPSGSKK